jgi:hypothetical protein
MDKPFLMSPEMHLERAAELRKVGSPSALALAVHHEALARVIARRLNGRSIEAPPLDPE